MALTPALALYACPVARAGSTPTVYTGQAVSLTASSATIEGAVNPRGQQTSYYVQYGTSSAYGGQSPVADLPAAGKTTHVAVALSNLTAGLTYHYRMLAVNASGLVGGADRTFKTAKIPLTFDVPAVPAVRPYAGAFRISGVLSGSQNAARPVALQADPFPYRGAFAPIGAPTLTGANGAFSFLVGGLAKSTQLRVVTVGGTPVHSAVMLQLVAVKITLHLRSAGHRGLARLTGSVTPAQPGAHVAFELLGPAGSAVRVGRIAALRSAGGLSRYSCVVPVRRHALYRAVVRMRAAAQVASRSRAVRVG